MCMTNWHDRKESMSMEIVLTNVRQKRHSISLITICLSVHDGSTNAFNTVHCKWFHVT